MFEKILHLLVCHALGDFWLQSAYLAEMKATSFYHLAIHSLLYIASFILVEGGTVSFKHILLFVSHLLIDGAKCCGKISFATDQTLHYLVLLIFLV